MRRNLLLGLVLGAAALLLIRLSGRGFPGAARLARRIHPGQNRPAPTYGYKEVNLS